MNQQPNRNGDTNPWSKKNLFRIVGSALVVAASGPLLKEKAWEQRLGIQDDTWQQALFIFGWAFLVLLIFYGIWALVETAIRKSKS